jgi:hypothetical protein
LVKNCPNENGIYYYVAKSFVLKNNSPKNDTQLFFSEEGVATFMSTGYRFKEFLEIISQLSGNLPRDARQMAPSGN